MEKKINIAEYLKDCPNGMELDCLMYENLYFDSLNSDYYGTINCYTLIDGIKTSINFTKYGTFNNHTGAKCVIFPKGKTTWDGFVPPCQFKNGDVLVSESGNIVLLSHVDSESIVHYHCIIPTYGSFRIEENTNIGVGRYYECVLANEQQKQRMYDKIKCSGYKYNQNTNKLEKLIEPKFKVGDKIKWKENHNYIYTITGIREKENKYECGVTFVLRFSEQDNWELVPNKFDINTLVPFESRVLVRNSYDGFWMPTFWGIYEAEKANRHLYRNYLTTKGFFLHCIPYNDDTKHLLGTTDDCDDYYKTWQK